MADNELIRDQSGGAVTVKFSELSDEELKRLCWIFPAAKAEYLQRFMVAQSLITKAG